MASAISHSRLQALCMCVLAALSCVLGLDSGGGLATATAAAAACPPCPDFCQLRTRCEAYTPFPVNLRWLKSAQFAGFYAAEALGYWEDECLGVSLRPASFDLDPVEYWDYPAERTVPRVTIPHYT
mmetsp:Transcript_22619/g.56808  ORF Transcript_22619/g.56808 Transcript_22619/m.56808 type:complete len:126 (-) Transcript_22619:9-386(-)